MNIQRPRLGKKSKLDKINPVSKINQNIIKYLLHLTWENACKLTLAFQSSMQKISSMGNHLFDYIQEFT